MATTTNYSWTTPDDTDLVKDGAAAIRTLGSSADTTVKNLNPGTTAGDIDYYTSATAKARIAIGTAGQVLQVNAGATAPEWASPAGGGKVLQVISSVITTQAAISTTTLTDSNITATITPSSTNSKILIMINANIYVNLQSATTSKYVGAALLRDATNILDYGTEGFRTDEHTSSTSFRLGNLNPVIHLDSPNTTSAITYKLQGKNGVATGSPTLYFQLSADYKSSITLMEIGA